MQHAGKAIVAGGVSGAIEICCTYPLEFTKTVAQLDKGGGGAMGVIRQTMKTSGPAGFYRGLSSMVYFATPKAAIRFSAFEQASNALRDQHTGKPMFGAATSFIAGLIAGTMEAIVVTTPQETIKIKLIDDAFRQEVPRFNGFFHGVSTIIKEEGTRAPEQHARRGWWSSGCGRGSDCGSDAPCGCITPDAPCGCIARLAAVSLALRLYRS